MWLTVCCFCCCCIFILHQSKIAPKLNRLIKTEACDTDSQTDENTERQRITTRTREEKQIDATPRAFIWLATLLLNRHMWCVLEVTASSTNKKHRYCAELISLDDLISWIWANTHHSECVCVWVSFLNSRHHQYRVPHTSDQYKMSPYRITSALTIHNSQLVLRGWLKFFLCHITCTANERILRLACGHIATQSRTSAK